MEIESVPQRPGIRSSVVLGAVALGVAAVHAIIAPRTLWEGDEILFAEAVRKFAPLQHHPHPPGYPLYVFLGKIANLVAGDPFLALVGLSVVATAVAFVAMTVAFRPLLRRPQLALAGALLVVFSPALLVHGSAPMSDTAGLALTCVAFAICGTAEWTSRRAAAVGVALSAAIGCRPQLAIALLPLLLWLVLVTIRGNRQRIAAVVSFTVTCLVWITPLVVATGGPLKFLHWQQGQAVYAATHDAVLSRGIWSAVDLLQRFVAHPWGPKVLSLPVLLLGTVGFLSLLIRRGRLRPAFPLLLACGALLFFALTTMDPADGVRYVMPTLPAVGLLVACAIDVLAARFRAAVIAGWVVVILLCAAFVRYSRPVLGPRMHSDSPPAAAAAWAAKNLAPSATILYEPGLRPHAEWFFPSHPMKPFSAVGDFVDADDVEVVVFAEGALPGAKTFSWPRSDAYGKMTRNHFRAVSLLTLRPEDRFRPEDGVFAFETTMDGRNWRWLARRASLTLPRAHSHGAQIVLTLPPESPIEENAVEILVDGRSAAHAIVRRGVPYDADIPLQRGGARVEIRSEKAFVPAAIIGNRDRREISVMLIRVSSN